MKYLLALMLTSISVSCPAALILDMPCQDDPTGGAVDDQSSLDEDGFVGTDVTQVSGPGGSYTNAFHFVTSTPQNVYLLLQKSLSFISNGASVQWFSKLDASNVVNNVCGENLGSQLQFTGSGTLTIRDEDGSNLGTASLSGITLTNWHHYAVTAISGHLWLLVDGTQQAQFDLDINAFKIAAWAHDDNTGYYAGALCGLRVYDANRTQPQILADAQIGGIGASPVTVPQQAIIIGKFIKKPPLITRPVILRRTF